jgi:SAM-dependent methyltransferase
MIKRLKLWVHRQKFDPGPLGIIVNPYFIARSRLRNAISGEAEGVSGRILDFGCGERPYEGLFGNAAAYVGLDIAVSGHPDSEKRVDVYYDGKNIPLDDRSFDVVFSSEVFEHVFNIEEILLEIRRVMKLDGTLIVSLPFAFPEHEKPYDFARYTSFGIRFLLERNGFEVVRVDKLGNYLVAVGQLICAFLFQSLSRWPVLQGFAQLFVIFPVSLFFEAAGRMFSRNHDLFCNLFVVARPMAATAGGKRSS